MVSRNGGFSIHYEYWGCLKESMHSNSRRSHKYSIWCYTALITPQELSSRLNAQSVGKRNALTLRRILLVMVSSVLNNKTSNSNDSTNSSVK